MQKFTKIVFTFILFHINYASFSQTDSTFFAPLDEVIVTGQYKPQSLKKSVYQVRVISEKQIRLQGATNIQEVLSDQLGFRFSNDNTLGITDVRLHGMGGNNVKILLDGVPMADRYDERVSLSQVDVNNIERIEIVEGPMSVSFGSDAMAGVINVITRKYNKESLSVTARVQEETVSNEYYPFSYKGVHNQNVNVHFKKKHFLVQGGGSHNDFDGLGGDEYGRGKSWKPKEQWMGNARLGYVDDHLNVYYRLDGVHETISARNPINFNNYKATDQNYVTDRYIHQLQGDYRMNDKLRLNGFLAYTDYQRKTNTVRHNFETNTIEPNRAAENDLSKLNSVAFKTTLQYDISPRLSLQPGIDINHEKANGARIDGSPEINDYAFFVSGEIKPVSWLNVRPGLRFSSNSQYDAPAVTPSVNTRINLNKHLDLRLAYGSGFRAPTLRELYLTFFDANHSLIGNTGLKAEHSNSVNGSLNLTSTLSKNTALHSVLSGFYNAYSNQIELLQSTTNNLEYTYYNIDQSRTLGASLENTLTWKKLDLSLGFSCLGYSSSQFDDEFYVKEDNRDYLWTPEINANIAYNLEKIHTRFGLFYKYTGAKPAFSFGTINSEEAIVLTRTSSFHMADLTASTQINRYLAVNMGVKNVFDVNTVENNVVSPSNTSHSATGPLPVAYGRSFFVGLNFQLQKNSSK